MANQRNHYNARYRYVYKQRPRHTHKHIHPIQNWTPEEKHFCIHKIINMDVSLIVFPQRFLLLSMSTPPSQILKLNDYLAFLPFHSIPTCPVHIFSIYNGFCASSIMHKDWLTWNTLSKWQARIINIFQSFIYQFSAIQTSFISYLN